jgi:hypothetical protein
VTETDDLWARYCRYRIADRRLGFALDVSRMDFDERFLERMQPAIARGLQAMSALEAGAIANRDEGRMVGHYWLRDPTLAPSPEIRSAIVDAVDSVRHFAARVHDGTTGRPAASAGRSRPSSTSASAARRSDRSFSRTRSARRATASRPASSTTPIPTASIGS